MSESDVSLDEILASGRRDEQDIVNVDEETVKLVIFVLGKDWYAFYGEHIREILSETDVFFLPGCPESLEGVINVRGDIESVLNLRRVLRYPDAVPAANTRILLAHGATLHSGIRVDRVEEVIDVVESTVLPPPHTIPEHLRPLVQGHIEFSGQIVSILDLDRLFDDYLAGGR